MNACAARVPNCYWLVAAADRAVLVAAAVGGPDFTVGSRDAGGNVFLDTLS